MTEWNTWTINADKEMKELEQSLKELTDELGIEIPSRSKLAGRGYKREATKQAEILTRLAEQSKEKTVKLEVRK